jgi:hypothetical protein
MKFKLLAAVASVALMSAGVTAYAQDNPKNDERPAAQHAQPKAEAAPRAGGAMKGEAMKGEAPKSAAGEEAPKAAETQHKEAPKAAETQRKESPKAAETQHKEAPKAAQTERKDAPKAAETQHKESSKAAQTQRKESPKAAETQHNQMQRQGEARPDAKAQNRSARSEENMKQGAADKRNEAQRSGGPARVTGKVKMSSEHAQRVGEALRREARPERVNVNIRIGERIPESVMVRPLPTEVVSIVPEYRGYDYFLDSDDEIVFVSPQTHEIVGTIDYEGRAAAEDATQVSGARPCPAND